MEEASSSWALYCSVCRRSYGSHFEWLKHLLEGRHQNGARLECQQWIEEDRGCVVVAYSSVPFSPHHSFEILEKLSSPKNGTFVTDFVLWDKRPKVAFIQFESREKVDEVIPCRRAMVEISFEQYRIQLKRASEMIELEWAEFFPHRTTSITNNGFDRDVPNLITETNRKRKASSDGDTTPSKSASRKRRTVENENAVGSSASKGTVNNNSISSSLKLQFLAIKEEMMIPEEEFKKALEVMHLAESIINDHYPNCKLQMFRHWYLKVKNNGTNNLLLFVDISGANIMRKCNILKHLRGLRDKFSRILLSSQSFKIGTKKLKECGLATMLIHCENKVAFQVFTDTYFLLETQACNLLKYLAEFDPRVIGLITLLNYWTRINDVCLSARVKTSNEKNVNNGILPIGAEPMSLEWMIVSYLISQKIIPSPREILKLPHTSLMYKNEDIGFSEDLEFARKWREIHNLPLADSDDFIMSLLSLAAGFFEFYGNLDGSYVLNAKDGELLASKEVLKKPCNSDSETKLTENELYILRKMINRKGGKSDGGKFLRILHPIFVHHYFSFDSRMFFGTFQQMFRDTAIRLRLALQQTNAESNVSDLKALLLLDCRKSAKKLKANSDNRHPVAPLLKPAIKRNEVVSKNVESNHTSSNNRTLDNPKTPNLNVQYLAITKEVAISEEEFTTASQLIGSLENIFKIRFPNCKLHMFRHWYLRVRNRGTNDLLLFLDAQGIWDNPRTTGILVNGHTLLQCYDLNQEVRKILPAWEYKISATFLPVGMSFMNYKFNMSFALFTHPHLILETQTCRLLKYLAEFDPRVIGLIRLMNYWARVNQVTLSASLTTPWEILPIVGAEPASLEWMIVSFLISQNVIPSVREVLDLPHANLVFKNQDIGFSEDDDFVRKWRESHNALQADSDEFIMSLLSLACGFFEFFGNINASCNLNTKDGELIDTSELLGTPCCSIKTKLTAGELKAVRKTEAASKKRNTHKKTLNIIHPLFVRFSISFDHNGFFSVFQKMFQETFQKLKLALQSYAESSHAFDLKTVLDCKCKDGL